MGDKKMVVIDQTIDLDRLDELEDQFAREQEADGYRHGLEMGKRAGEEEGLALGAIEGAKRGSELGYLHGFTMTYKQICSNDNQATVKTSDTRSKKVLDDILRLVDEFPRTNANDCDEKLAKIRIKFKRAFANVPHQAE